MRVLVSHRNTLVFRNLSIHIVSHQRDNIFLLYIDTSEKLTHTHTLYNKEDRANVGPNKLKCGAEAGDNFTVCAFLLIEAVSLNLITVFVCQPISCKETYILNCYQDIAFN